MSDQNSEQEPWYRDGLNFTCTQCGNCCTGAPGVVWVDDAEIKAIADLTGKSTGEILLMHTRLYAGRRTLTEYANGDCTFFDPEKRGCTIYEARPVQCRTWPFWNSNLKDKASWDSLSPDCPGAGKGAFVSFEEIQKRSEQIDL
ncbi:YkgJ family cysteine cluster protein [Gimesia chilikensis]|uniref:Flagellin N-methylase n=1 Tax=Gimesia chilikensis TaxID=2605989 RepID=A0A517WGG1_9PLAN|nr:YkgJ family cysteine cluster protein [Gimesia chilikensis]KAA0133626.1 YkgJ family cysteine cluster protein [Gimesia chilikensis]MCR9233884.1 YkgJ family cysteine cluster protein [bacterium]QDT86247.1 Flagellin N-methylase [Gimesia chilikensis]QDU04333.1 Flagellin N-methylase [Gimesia chilikensis]